MKKPDNFTDDEWVSFNSKSGLQRQVDDLNKRVKKLEKIHENSD